MILERLTALVVDEGGLLAGAMRPTPDGTTPHGDLVAQGPRAAGHAADLPLVVEAVREGYLLHHGGPGGGRIMGREDDDLALLAGDRLYALGLERLAAAGDLEAVAALADLIALSAQAATGGPAGRAGTDTSLTVAVWAAGCAEVGWGSTATLDRAKEAARAGISTAEEQLRAATRQIVGDLALPR